MLCWSDNSKALNIFNETDEQNSEEQEKNSFQNWFWTDEGSDENILFSIDYDKENMNVSEWQNLFAPIYAILLHRKTAKTLQLKWFFSLLLALVVPKATQTTLHQ